MVQEADVDRIRDKGAAIIALHGYQGRSLLQLSKEVAEVKSVPVFQVSPQYDFQLSRGNPTSRIWDSVRNRGKTCKGRGIRWRSRHLPTWNTQDDCEVVGLPSLSESGFTGLWRVDKLTVIPAKAGISPPTRRGSRLRGNDEKERSKIFTLNLPTRPKGFAALDPHWRNPETKRITIQTTTLQSSCKRATMLPDSIAPAGLHSALFDIPTPGGYPQSRQLATPPVWVGHSPSSTLWVTSSKLPTTYIQHPRLRISPDIPTRCSQSPHPSTLSIPFRWIRACSIWL